MRERFPVPPGDTNKLWLELILDAEVKVPVGANGLRGKTVLRGMESGVLRNLFGHRAIVSVRHFAVIASPSADTGATVGSRVLLTCRAPCGSARVVQATITES